MSIARIGVFSVDELSVDTVVALFRDVVTPRFAAIDGFLGYQAFTENGGCRYIGISYWASIAAMDASAEVAKQAREDAARLGAEIIGDPILTTERFDTRKR